MTSDAARIRQDLGALEAVISRVNTYTTKAMAHRDDSPRRVPAAPAVTWDELDAAVEAVGGICKKCYLLRHPGEALGALTPEIAGLDPDVPDRMDATRIHPAG